MRGSPGVLAGLIFDCDGVLADTERDGHLVAFNRTFSELGVPVRWSEGEYAARLRIGGGKERLASLLTPAFVSEAHLPQDVDAQREIVATWHRRKTELYTGMVEAGLLPPRPGIARIVRDAHDAGIKLAVASTSAVESVRAVLEHAVGEQLAGAFTVLAGDIVVHKKPAPDIYQLAVERLQLDPLCVLAIEDSRNGLSAAVRAGLRCVITVSSYTHEEQFDEAALVVTSLGDPGAVDAHVLSNHSAARPGRYVTLADLRACLEDG